MPGSVLLALALGGAPAEAADVSERLSVGVPVEVALVGLSAGVHPELLFRPFRPDGGTHLRVGAGVMVGPELVNLPLTVGVRHAFGKDWAVRPAVGTGLQLQLFLPRQHEPAPRGDLFMEVGLDARVAEGWRVSAQLSPEFGMIGGFGLGFATRVGVVRDF